MLNCVFFFTFTNVSGIYRKSDYSKNRGKVYVSIFLLLVDQIFLIIVELSNQTYLGGGGRG